MSVVRAAASPARLAEIAAWWALLVGVWLLTLSSFNIEDFGVAAACAVPCAVVAVLARFAVGGRWAFRLAWLAWLGPLARSALTDGVRVSVAAVRHRGRRGSVGHLLEIALPAEDGEAATAGRESVAQLTMSTTPGSFVVHGDPETLVLHSLLSEEPALARTVTR